MSRLTPLILMPMFALAACGGGGPTVKGENASIADVTKATQDAVKMQPGQWQTQIKFVSVDMPGLPKAQADMMGQQMAKASENVVETCLTPEMVSKPPSEMFGGKAGGGCKYDSYELADGKLNAVMTCKPQGAGGEVKSTTTGTIGSTSYELTSDTAVSGAPGMPGGSMKMKTQVTGKRVGECTAPQTKG